MQQWIPVFAGGRRASVAALCALFILISSFGPGALASGTDPLLSRRIAQGAIEDANAVSSAPVEHADPESDEELVRKIEIDTLGAYPYRPWQRIKEGGSLLLDKQNLMTIGIGALAIVGARSLDSEAQEYFGHKGRIGSIDKFGNEVLGTGVPGTLLGAGLWLYGDLTGNFYEAHAGQATLETLLVTGIVTAILKGAVNRERPDGSDHFSWPSGHTSTVFASAMVLQEFYGWKAGVPAFMLGALTAVGRMQENRHWLSDTVSGALFGIVIGHAFSRAHLDRVSALKAGAPEKTVRIDIKPMFKSGGGGLLFKATF